KGVLGPANMFLVDTTSGEIRHNDEIKAHYAKAHPYQKWLDKQLISLDTLSEVDETQSLSEKELFTLWKMFGYTDEIIRTLILPMAEKGEEPVISMGFDSPLAILS